MIRLYAMTCGWLSSHLGNFLAGAHGRIRVPVPCYLVHHPRGRLVFDTGLHPHAIDDPRARLGVLADLFDVEYRRGDELASRLATLDLAPSDIDFIVGSHLHFDHVGGNAQVPDARLVVQRREWHAGHDDDLTAANHYDRRDYDLGHDVLEVDGEHDLFGDGSVVCIPTFGHTPGHQSLRVRLASGDVILAADACYLRKTLHDLHLPTVVHDEAQMVASLHRLRSLERRGARIFFGHDPDFWAGVPQAPAQVV